MLVIGCPNAEGFLGSEPDNLLNMPPHHITWWSRRSLEFIAQAWNLAVVTIKEESLEDQYRRAFMYSFWLRWLASRAIANHQFLLAGARYRISSLAATVMSRLTFRFLAGFEKCIRGHTITAVLQKRA